MLQVVKRLTSPVFGCLFVILSSSQAISQCHYSAPIRHHSGQTTWVCPTYGAPVYQPPIVYGRVEYGQPALRPVATTRAPTPLEQARNLTNEAKSLFKRRDYSSAIKKLDTVVKLAPQDTNAYQFRSLAAFAISDFDDAAADAYDSLSLGNAWTSPVVESLYGNEISQYKMQMVVLKQKAESSPSMQNHFLLAYHYLINERWAEGKSQLQQVLKIQAEEPLATKLLAAVNSKLADSKQVAIQPAGTN